VGGDENFIEGIDKWYKKGKNKVEELDIRERIDEYMQEVVNLLLTQKGFIYQGPIPVKIDWEDFSENSLRRKDFRKG
jgi:hypothetical protein